MEIKIIMNLIMCYKLIWLNNKIKNKKLIIVCNLINQNKFKIKD